MQISKLSVYTPFKHIEFGRKKTNRSFRVHNSAEGHHDQFVKSIAIDSDYFDEKQAGIKGVAQNADLMHKDTKANEKTIYERLKKVISKGQEVGFQEGKVKEDIGKSITAIITSVRFGELMENGIPKTVSFVDDLGDTILEYKLDENEGKNPFEHYTVTEYNIDTKSEYEMNKDKAVSRTISHKNSDIVKSLTLDKDGYDYTVLKSNQGENPEIVSLLCVPDIETGIGKTYVTHCGQNTMLYSYDHDENAWIQEK